jgi:nucleoid DNA-binding protein
MTRKELAKKIANKFNLSIAESDRILKYSLAEMKKELRNRGRIDFRGFGTFHTIRLNDRIYHDPNTKKIITIPASNRAIFRQSKNLFAKKRHLKPST